MLMVRTLEQAAWNRQSACRASRQPQLPPHALAKGIKRMLAWQDRAEAKLRAVREQLELAQWALFIKDELDDGEQGLLPTDPDAVRELLMTAAGCFEAAQASMAALWRGGTAFSFDMPGPSVLP